jgi:hypothetical protein
VAFILFLCQLHGGGGQHKSIYKNNTDREFLLFPFSFPVFNLLLAGMVLILICYFALRDACKGLPYGTSPFTEHGTPNDKSALLLDASAARRRLDRRQATSSAY